MAKVSVLEGQLERNFGGVKLLRTDLASGGSCEWIPEDDVQLTTLNIKKNGTYKASDYADNHGTKYYGFSEITVSVTGRTTIVDPEDGNEYSVELDEKDEIGKLKKTVLPSSIDVVGLPTKTTYRENDPINKSGMVVKAYLADGTLYDYKNYQFGGIPLSELEIEPTHAHGSGGGGVSGAWAPVPVFIGSGVPTTEEIEAQGIDIGDNTESRHMFILASSNAPLCKCNYIAFDSGYYCVVCSVKAYQYSSDDEKIYLYYILYDDIDPERIYRGIHSFGHSMSYGELYYIDPSTWSQVIQSKLNPSIPVFGTLGDHAKDSSLPLSLAAMDDGIWEPESESSVTVKWKRPEDGKELTDTFKVNVIPANTSGGETQGSDTGGDDNTTGGGGSW